MSRKRGLSKEELEIQRVLSPSSQGTQSGGVTPGQTGITIHAAADPPQAPVSLSDECMTKFAKIMSRSIAGAVREEFDRRDQYLDEFDDDEEYGDYDEGTDRATDYGDDALDDNNNDVPLVPNPLPLDGIGVNANVGADRPVDPVPPPNAKIDKTLPQARRKRPTTNWYPREDVLEWAADVIDGLEMTDEDRKDVVAEFCPEPKWDHLFTAVAPPGDMKKAMEHPETIRCDWLFSRLEAEENFQRSHDDIACGLRILIEVMSDLKLTPGSDRNRFLLGRLFQFMTSAASHGNRGRRELGRKFVPQDNAPTLYATKPSHYSFFGGPSTSSAVTQAVADARVNKDLIIMPKKRTFRRFAHPGGKAMYLSRERPFRYQNSRSSYNRSGKFQYGRRGRGRGTRRKPRQRRGTSKPSTQE